MTCCKKPKSQQNDDSHGNEAELTSFVYTKDTVLQLLLPIFQYYNDVVSDYLVLKDYFFAHEFGYFGITCFAMICSVTAQTIYSKSVTTFSKDVTNTPKCLRILISMCYGTPLFIIYYMIQYEWLCKKRTKTQQTPANANEMELKFMILDESIIESNRISTFNAYFQSSILTFVQVYILSQYIILKPQHITLSYPSTTIQFGILLWSTTMSFKALADCAWARIEGFISKTDGVGTGVKLLFRLRAIIETFIRALRFMICTMILQNVFHDGVVGIAVLLLEFIWKYIVCWWFARGKDNMDLNFKIYTVATWMIFSHERFKKYPYFMRICDIFIWTAFLVVIPIIFAYVHALDDMLHFDGICVQFLQFRNNCIPIELMLLLLLFWIILGMCYYFTPSIFSMNYKAEVKPNIAAPQQVESVSPVTPDVPDAMIEIASVSPDVNSTDEKPQCLQCKAALNGPITSGFPQISVCRKCQQTITKQYYICTECQAQDTKEYAYCIDCCKVNIDDDKDAYQRGTGRAALEMKDFTLDNAFMINKFSEPQLQLVAHPPPGEDMKQAMAMPAKKDVATNETSNTGNGYERGKVRPKHLTKMRDFTLTNAVMIDRFSSPQQEVTQPLPQESFERGSGRFGNDYTMQQSVTLNAFNQQPRQFERGNGRFGNDYTMQQQCTLNAFNHQPQPFVRGAGRFNNDYTMTQSSMIQNYNDNK
eukprot:264691_1